MYNPEVWYSEHIHRSKSVTPEFLIEHKDHLDFIRVSNNRYICPSWIKETKQENWDFETILCTEFHI